MKMKVCPSSKTITFIPDKEKTIDLEKAKQLMIEEGGVLLAEKKGMVVFLKVGDCGYDVRITIMKNGKVLMKGVPKGSEKEYEKLAEKLLKL